MSVSDDSFGDFMMDTSLVSISLFYVTELQSKLFTTSFVITEYSISDVKLLGTDLFPLKFPL